MKGKLIKCVDFYGLKINDYIVGLSDLSTNKMLNYPYNLRKANCDELFGVITAENMMKDIESNCSRVKEGFILGFQTAMDLNKDKLFTIVDITYAIISFSARMKPSEIVKNLLKQPTEIDVEILTMERWEYGDFEYKELSIKPKLDYDKCLILKKAE
jgi:hypothetical protein